VPAKKPKAKAKAAPKAKPAPAAKFPSAEAARLRGQEGLVQLPYLTVNDLLALRKAGFKDVEDLERRWHEIPDEAWRSVVYLVEARVLRLPTEIPRDLSAGLA